MCVCLCGWMCECMRRETWKCVGVWKGKEVHKWMRGVGGMGEWRCKQRHN